MLNGLNIDYKSPLRTFKIDVSDKFGFASLLVRDPVDSDVDDGHPLFDHVTPDQVGEADSDDDDVGGLAESQEVFVGGGNDDRA